MTAAVWAVAVGLIAVTVIVLLAWTTDGRSGSSAAAALRTSADVWLLAHGARLRVPGASFSLLPLGLTALPAYLLARAGASLARTASVTALREAVRVTGALTLSYAVLAVVITGPAAGSQLRAGPVGAFAGAALLAAGCGGAGVLRGSGLWPDAWHLLPEPARAGIQGAAVAAGVVLAGAAALAGAALAVSAGEAGHVLSALSVGVAGTIVLMVISLAYLPNAVVWSAAFLIGPGFAVGSGTHVAISAVRLRPLPALPLLAALPGGPVNPWLAEAWLLPVAAGLLAGAVIARQQAGRPLRPLLGTAAAAGPGAGVLLGLLCLLSAGSAGAGGLATIGPSAWRVALVLTAEVGLPAVAAAWWVARLTAGRAAARAD